ncbi:hypothetical protein GCM10011383_03250 [Hymenobacter cavernae]|uniref:Uncharacterized protein n=1 Tax=Hymenobacter cavernae TaxID=2044852 RepID=A0ABQ1TLG0_9BACT|nr:hypothetical protein GCM10011383_03250 [Hymenobacter cavernae]
MVAFTLEPLPEVLVVLVVVVVAAAGLTVVLDVLVAVVLLVACCVVVGVWAMAAALNKLNKQVSWRGRNMVVGIR